MVGRRVWVEIVVDLSELGLSHTHTPTAVSLVRQWLVDDSKKKKKEKKDMLSLTFFNDIF